jgi:hypothetical protein
MEQLDLQIEVVQPKEAYLLYRRVNSSWDGLVPNPSYQQDEDYSGFCGILSMIPGRIYDNYTVFECVIVDSHTLNVMKSRFEEYEKKTEAEILAKHSEDKNVIASVEYYLVKVKRTTIPLTTIK